MSMHAFFGGDSPETITQRLLAELHKLGAVRMEAEYSGGNDEGGVDSITLMNEAGEQMDTSQLSYEHPIWAAADDLLGTEFGTWAGEFSAGGTLFADLLEQRAWTEGWMQVPSEESRSFEVQL